MSYATYEKGLENRNSIFLITTNPQLSQNSFFFSFTIRSISFCSTKIRLLCPYLSSSPTSQVYNICRIYYSFVNLCLFLISVLICECAFFICVCVFVCVLYMCMYRGCAHNYIYIWRPEVNIFLYDTSPHFEIALKLEFTD